MLHVTAVVGWLFMDRLLTLQESIEKCLCTQYKWQTRRRQRTPRRVEPTKAQTWTLYDMWTDYNDDHHRKPLQKLLSSSKELCFLVWSRLSERKRTLPFPLWLKSSHRVLTIMKTFVQFMGCFLLPLVLCGQEKKGQKMSWIISWLLKGQHFEKCTLVQFHESLSNYIFSFIFH